MRRFISICIVFTSLFVFACEDPAQDLLDLKKPETTHSQDVDHDDESGEGEDYDESDDADNPDSGEGDLDDESETDNDEES